MIDQELSNKILTIGCQYQPPRGGVAQVVSNYSKYVYVNFKYVANSGGHNIFEKSLICIEAFIKTLFILIKDRQINIVHIHTASYNSFKRSAYFLSLSKIFHKKVIMHIHGGAFREYYSSKPKWISSVLNRCDVIVVLTKKWKDFFSTITISKIEIVNNIVPKPIYSKNNHDDNIHLLFLGLLSEKKGLYDLLDILNNNYDWALRNKVILEVAGGGDVNRFLDTINKDNLSSIVHFHGFVSGTEKADLLSIADISILPSYAEGLPISILESMSYGLPILASNVGGIPDVVEDGVNGFLINPGDKVEIFNKLKKLVSNPSLRREMGDKSEDKVKSHYPEIVAKKLEMMYLDLLKN